MGDLASARARYGGRRVLVLGAGKSGVAVARLLRRLDAEVALSERAPGPHPWLPVLEASGVRVILGEPPADDVFDEGKGPLAGRIELVVKNPGIPYRHPYVQAAFARGIPVVTEIEVAYHVARGRMIGITGSNGKTTTATLVAHMLRESGMSVVLAGNIGEPLSAVVESLSPHTTTVLELSSFQLRGVDRFRADIAVLTNLFPHHLDYHETMDDYVESKWRLFARLAPEGRAILPAHGLGAVFAERLASTGASWWRFGWVEDESEYGGNGGMHRRAGAAPVADGVYAVPLRRGEGPAAREAAVVWVRGETRTVLFSSADLAVLGRHNVENAAAAAACALAAGAQVVAVRRAVSAFRGIEHRLEFVRDLAGVRFYNDAKSTNPEATASALAAFSAPVVLIAGGLERGESFAPLVPFWRTRVRRMIVYGETAMRLKREAEAAGLSAVDAVGGVEEAVSAAWRAARPGDVVLFSPGCASWDMFPSFEVRGRRFKDAVWGLGGKEDGDGGEHATGSANFGTRR
ncbi:MAG: UDP-N-acetylmuramoyl-L-alanine--D-glutamate ligase [Hydrogenibacillus sp.]|nr:UDP-N-acetylmuramoyl-L-alanine--D-glutamate ligase [Hydrogenibacillus sp.]